MDSSALLHAGLGHLHALRRPYGFDATGGQDGLYSTLFGRDSLWMLMLLLEADRIAPSTSISALVADAGPDILSSLARLQGTVVEDQIEEQPGKILHEYRPSLDDRVVPLEIPFLDGRSYAGFDQTFLFITAFRMFMERYPESRLFECLLPHVERALGWVDGYASSAEGLYRSTRRDPRNLLNQVWKDSFDSAVQTGLDVPPPPLAWIDVQAYAYRALLDAAWIATRRGHQVEACGLRTRATELQRRVEEAFWLDDEQYYAMALDGRQRQVTMVASNPGHMLWAEMVPPHRIDGVARRLMQPDLLSRYGLRTLSDASPFFSPFSHHRGNIWPFDNAIVALGLHRSGYQAEARDLSQRVGGALTRIGTPVELYVALSSDVLVDTPTAQGELLAIRRPPSRAENTIQGWSAAALVVFAALLDARDRPGGTDAAGTP